MKKLIFVIVFLFLGGGGADYLLVKRPYNAFRVMTIYWDNRRGQIYKENNTIGESFCQLYVIRKL